MEGTGTENNPFIITSAVELREFISMNNTDTTATDMYGKFLNSINCDDTIDKWSTVTWNRANNERRKHIDLNGNVLRNIFSPASEGSIIKIYKTLRNDITKIIFKNGKIINIEANGNKTLFKPGFQKFTQYQIDYGYISFENIALSAKLVCTEINAAFEYCIFDKCSVYVNGTNIRVTKDCIIDDTLFEFDITNSVSRVLFYYSDIDWTSGVNGCLIQNSKYICYSSTNVIFSKICDSCIEIDYAGNQNPQLAATATGLNVYNSDMLPGITDTDNIKGCTSAQIRNNTDLNEKGFSVHIKNETEVQDG